MSFYLTMLRIWLGGKNPIYERYLRGRKVLDVGCGPTSIIKYDKENFEGFDINPRVVEEALQKGYKVQVGNATEIPYPDSRFDVCHCSNIIEHLTPDEAQKMVREMARVVRVGGLLLIISPMPSTVWNTFGHIKPYPPAAIKKLLRKESYESFDSVHNLKIVNTFYYGNFAWHPITFLLSTLLATVLTWFRGSYLMVLEKTEG